jgi:protein MAK11
MVHSVKAIDTLRIARPDGSATTILASCSSDGTIHVYDLSSLPSSHPSSSSFNPTEIEPVAKYDTKGTRLTCIALADGGGDTDEVESAVGKRKREEDEEEDEEDDWKSEIEGDEEE